MRLPKDYRFSGREVAVKRFGTGVLLLPIDDPWQLLEAGLEAFEPGWVLSREQPDEQTRVAIHLRASLERRGTPVGSLDTMIAAHALSQQATLITNNLREFAQVTDLHVENWVPAT
ncbi:PIN domain-containing protein [Synechococcus sp. CCY9201]|uniref:PIN domain-containing protein n=1 Tax=Synechococcus sp. CCY9201 TaxID=174697 RepID=UPI002B2054B6|nr:PIN domain-containing protein [Synechococcus sp. CCY9201]MEA5474291.1 PIN domain-containing protein [Synechococcus sp. CCY9201]